MFQTKDSEKNKIHILCSIFFPPENRAVYEITWESVIEPNRPHVTIFTVQKRRDLHAG